MAINDSALEQRIQIQLGSNKAIIIVKTILGDYKKKKKRRRIQLATPRTEYRRGSFVPCTIREWNDLPSGTVTSETLDTFVSVLSISIGNAIIYGLLGHRTGNVKGL